MWIIYAGCGFVVDYFIPEQLQIDKSDRRARPFHVEKKRHITSRLSHDVFFEFFFLINKYCYIHVFAVYLDDIHKDGYELVLVHAMEYPYVPESSKMYLKLHMNV